jgi:hypothetical protein
MSTNIKRSGEFPDKTKTKTTTITFRLPVNLINELRKDAELAKINLNTFATKIFMSHIQWERYERRMGFLPMTKPFLKEAINQMTSDQIINMAQRIEIENFKNIFTFTRQNHDIDSFIDLLRNWLTVSWMDHTIVNRNGSYYFNIEHDLGFKWSLYVKTLVSELYQDLLGKKVEIKISDNVISFVFSKV